MKSFYSNGKLLLTGEYAVLDGAKAWAIPTKFGQSLNITEKNSSQLEWKSFDEKGNIWFESIYDLDPLVEVSSSSTEISKALLSLLCEAKKLNPKFLTDSNGYEIDTSLDFPRNWGLGSSSTLINNIAQWAEINAFELLKNSFGGSGYDIACAQNDQPIFYQLREGVPHIEKASFDLPFKNRLFFIHLNKKQNTADEIKRYSKKDSGKINLVSEISALTDKISGCLTLEKFELLLNEHEAILSETLNSKPIKEIEFPDYWGAIKSLGAWGGDFILASGNENTTDYFKKKGYTTVIPFDDMILS